MRRSALSALLVLPIALGLAGCHPNAPSPGVTNEPTVTASPPGASATPAAIDPDVVMVVTTTATADNGAVLDLTITVHKPVAWSDAASAELASLMTTACGGGTDAGVYSSNLWTFAAVDVDAVARPGATWPTDRRLFLEPFASYVSVASAGFPSDDDEVDAATPDCRRDKFFESAGSGTVVVGFAGDTDEVDAAGHFTKWANHRWGVSGVRVAGQTTETSGITLSACTHVVTALGASLHGDADWWSNLDNGTHCLFGSGQETQDF